MSNKVYMEIKKEKENRMKKILTLFAILCGTVMYMQKIDALEPLEAAVSAQEYWMNRLDEAGDHAATITDQWHEWLKTYMVDSTASRMYNREEATREEIEDYVNNLNANAMEVEE